MINPKIYIPPHRRSSQNNVYVPPHRRFENSSKISSKEKSSVSDNCKKDSKHHASIESKANISYSSSSSSNSVESLIDIFSTVNVDDSRTSPQIDCSKYLHILELTGFTANETSTDIENLFRDYLKSGFLLKWVDDNHCLIVFSSPEIANLAISDKNLTNKLVLNTILKSCRNSKWKILKSPGDWALPYKSRPPVLLNPTRRMIYHSLGIKSQITEVQKEIEKKKIEDFKNNLQ